MGIELEGKLISELEGFSELANVAKEMNIDVWQWILAGGEDHVFLGTDEELPQGGLEIGRVISGSGVKINDASEITDLGWRHF